MITGQMDCPRCGELLTYTCELQIGPVVARDRDHVKFACAVVNADTDHHCKISAGFPIAC